MSRQANVVKSARNGVTPKRADEVTQDNTLRRRQYTNENAELPSNTCSWFGDGFYSQEYATRCWIWLASEKSVASVNPKQELVALCVTAKCNPKRIRYLRLPDARKLFGLVNVA